MLADTKRIIAHLIDRAHLEAAEVASLRQGDVDELVEEVEHARQTVAPQVVALDHGAPALGRLLAAS